MGLAADIAAAPQLGPLERNRPELHLNWIAPMLRVERLKKVFRSGESDLVLFDNLSFQVAQGELVAIAKRIAGTLFQPKVVLAG